MSVVPVTGILRKHYREAAQDIEYKSSRFWQAWLQRAFHEVDMYSVSCEMSPDDSLRRVDAVVERYDADHDTLSAMLWVECKRPSGSVRQVESQALDAAVRCVTRDNLQYVYVMTTVGVSFRAWVVYENERELQPFHGDLAVATRSQYINADSSEAGVLMTFVDRVKQYPPLRVAPVVPSQPLPQRGYEQSGYDQRDSGGYAGLQQGYQFPIGQDEYASGAYGRDSASGTAYQGQDVASSGRGYGQAVAAGDQLVKVQVSRVGHLTRATEYIFSDVNGNKKSTTKDDWRETPCKGNAAWITQRRGVGYYTRERIG